MTRTNHLEKPNGGVLYLVGPGDGVGQFFILKVALVLIFVYLRGFPLFVFGLGIQNRENLIF